MVPSRQCGWIGVDIGTHAVKMTQVERRSDGLQLVDALVLRRREPWSAGNVELPVASSSEELIAGISLGGEFHGRDTAVVLPMAACETRGCTIPDDDQQDPTTAVLKEMEEVYGELAPARDFDYWPVRLPREDGPSQENTIIFSLPESWTERTSEDLTQARLAGRVLDALPLALARAIELGSPGASRQPVAAIDWGCGRATFCTVLGGRPLFVRCLRDAAYLRMQDRLSESLSVTLDEAQQLLSDHGLPRCTRNSCEEIQSVIEEVTSEPLNRLMDEINRTIDFLRQQRRALVPQKLVLFGGGASVRNIDKYLSQRLEMTTEIWNMHLIEGENGGHNIPMPMLGPAVALSALAWAKP